MAISKKFGLFIKAVIIVVSFTYIAYRLVNEVKSNSFTEVFNISHASKYGLLGLAILLMPINWGIETIKWQFIVRKLEKVPFTKSIKAVLAGITVAIFTPNRVGEFGGRILALERRNRISGLFATLLGGYSQMLITLIMGFIALPYYLMHFPHQLPKIFYSPILFLIFGVVIIALIIVYLKIRFFVHIIEHWISNPKKKRFINFLQSYKTYELLKIGAFSFLRFMVFSSQFYLLLLFFNVNLLPIQGILSISLVYFIMSLIPVISLFEFGVRGSVALLVLGVYTPLGTSIITATFLLWIINLAVPAILGSIALYRFKI